MKNCQRKTGKHINYFHIRGFTIKDRAFLLQENSNKKIALFQSPVYIFKKYT